MDVDNAGGGAAGAQNGQDMSKRQGLISVNDLTYVLEPDLSVAVNKTHKKHFFQNATYNHQQRAICILNSGADYIDTTRSYLSFELDVKNMGANQGVLFGTHGSVLNVIDNITISTRSGDELCRLTEFGLFQNMILPISYDRDWFRTHGDLMGFGQGVFETKAAHNPNDLDETAVDPKFSKPRYVIPMYVLAPIFGYGRLMPAMLMSGLRIEIGWTAPSKAFMCVLEEGAVEDVVYKSTVVAPVVGNAGTFTYTDVGGNFDYDIKEPYFSLASVQLSDSIQRALNEQSATNGLEIVYCDYEKTDVVTGGNQKKFHVEVRKSCSRALKAFARIRQANTQHVPQRFTDSFKSEFLCPIVNYQWQLGSLYFPQQPVKNDSFVSTMREAYMHLLESVDKWKGKSPLLTFNGSNDVTDFVNDSRSGGRVIGRGKQHLGHTDMRYRSHSDVVVFARPGGYVYDQHVIGVTLERSTMFNLAGVPVNNSRVLALHAELGGPDYPFQKACSAAQNDAGNVLADITNNTSTRQLSIYLKYVKLARVFLNNVEVEQ